MLPDARPGPSICARAEAVLHAGPMSSPGPATPLDLLGLPLDRLTRFLVDDLAERPFPRDSSTAGSTSGAPPTSTR